MSHLLRQGGFFFVTAYCLLRLYELLWAQKTFPFMLQIVMAAGGCYVATRAWMFVKQGPKISPSEQAIAGWLALFVFSLAAQHAFIGSMDGMDEVNSFSFTFNVFINDIFWLLAGAALSLCTIGISVVRAAVILVIMCLCVFNGSGEDSLFVNYSLIMANSGLENLSHLNVAEFAVCLIFISYASVRQLRVVVFIIGVVVLFLLGGRSSLYFTIFAIGVYEVLSGGRRSILYFLVLGVALAGLFLLALQLGWLDYENKFVQQMLMIDGLDEDASYQERQYISTRSLELLPQQILFGNPTLIVENFGVIGSYLHNILSVWQFFGILPFLATCAILVSCALRMRKALASERNPLVTFGALLLIYTIVSVLLSKAFGFRFLWVSIGFWMLKPELLSYRRPARRKSSSVARQLPGARRKRRHKHVSRSSAT